MKETIDISVIDMLVIDCFYPKKCHLSRIRKNSYVSDKKGDNFLTHSIISQIITKSNTYAQIYYIVFIKYAHKLARTCMSRQLMFAKKIVFFNKTTVFS